ncbi:jg24250, partial [Pararge aegeria aegeria]
NQSCKRCGRSPVSPVRPAAAAASLARSPHLDAHPAAERAAQASAPHPQCAPAPPAPPDTDDEGEDIFRRQPHPSQPILVAAHNLHKAVREWSSKDNEIIAAAKRMAILMARLSDLVRSDSK